MCRQKRAHIKQVKTRKPSGQRKICKFFPPILLELDRLETLVSDGGDDDDGKAAPLTVAPHFWDSVSVLGAAIRWRRGRRQPTEAAALCWLGKRVVILPHGRH